MRAKLFKSWKCRHQGSSNFIPASNNHTVEVMNKDFLDLFKEEKNLILLQRIKNIIRTFVFVYIAAYYVKQSIENQKYTCLWILISEGFILYRANAYRNIGLIWKKTNGWAYIGVGIVHRMKFCYQSTDWWLKKSGMVTELHINYAIQSYFSWLNGIVLHFESPLNYISVSFYLT